MANLIFDLLDAIAVELHDFFAILTDEVIVLWAIGVVGIVKLVRLPEVHLVYEVALGQQRQRAVHRGAGDGSVPFSRPLEKLVGREMLLSVEYRVDDHAPLVGDAKILLLKKLDEFPLRLFSHFPLLCFYMPVVT